MSARRMSARRTRSAGLRNRREKRTRTFKFACSKDEYELLMDVARQSNQHGGTWARDTLLSRALRLRSQRLLLR
ncbi:MAG: hypothetical protein K0S65_2073 [Labilithrix sp.]|nr:hypothetical protein [Labilithrix sp.]